ncbi:hypothetical protein Tco_0979622 [Tanacetum coccineum]
MGETDVILGIKIKRENKWIVITQSHYIEKILKKFNREDCSPVSTPMDPVEKLKPNTGKPVDQLEYSRAIGCLMYAMTSTRPDIAYAVGRLGRFTSNPSRQHWQAITRCLVGSWYLLFCNYLLLVDADLKKKIGGGGGGSRQVVVNGSHLEWWIKNKEKVNKEELNIKRDIGENR